MVRFEPPSSVTVYVLGRLEPVVAVVTVMLPVSAVQVTAKAVTAVAPSLTATVRGLGAVTVQLVATPVSSTVWLATLSPLNVTPVLLLFPIDWLVVPSTVTVYPSVSTLSPDVLVVTRRLPLGGGVTAKVLLVAAVSGGAVARSV